MLAGMRRWLITWVIAAVALSPGAQAQTPAPTQAPDSDFAALSDAEHALISVPEHRQTCPDSADGVIVVCAKDHTARYRVPSSIEDAPGSRAALRDGATHTPNLRTDPCGQEGAHCRRVGSAPPPIYYIDLAKIPLPPPGSDADKIAQGEMRAP